MAHQSSRYSNISLGSGQGKIFLSERQIALIKERRQRDTQPQKSKDKVALATTKPINRSVISLAKKLQEQGLAKAAATATATTSGSWGEEPNGTLPTASWSSASDMTSAASASTAPLDAKKEFYGQALQPKERKKMYDDTGASYYEESGSEVSAASERSSSTASHKKLETSSTALTEALTKTSSHDSIVGGETENKASSPTNSSCSHDKPVDKVADLKKRWKAATMEKRKAQGKPHAPVVESSSQEHQRNRRSSFGLNRPKNATAPDNQQQAFLRNLIESAYKPKEEKPVVEEAKKDNKVSKTNNRLSMSIHKSAANSHSQPGTSSSLSSAEDKAILKKVLERTERIRKKKSVVTPRAFMKNSSSKLNKLISPISRTSAESANDERSEPRRSITPKKQLRNSGKKTPRREKNGRSPRFLSSASRWSGASQADDEAESLSKEPIARDASESTTEEASELSESDKISVEKLEIPHQKTMLTEETPLEPKKEQVFLASAKVGKVPPVLVDMKHDATEVSALTRRSALDTTSETISQTGGNKEEIVFDDDCMSNQQSMLSRPSIMYEKDIKIEAGGHDRFARAVTESLMEPVDLDSPKESQNGDHSFTGSEAEAALDETTEEDHDADDSIDPEGYAEFVATLKAEVAGSHSLLWESFHGLFREGQESRHLSHGKSCHFDDKTKDVVTNMSTYLKKKNPVNCTIGTQLANDKSVRENPTPTPLFGRNLHDDHSVDEYESDKENGRSLMQVPSTDSINEASVNNEIEVTLGQFVRKSMGGGPPLPEKKAPAPPVPPAVKPLQTKALKSSFKSKTSKPIDPPQRVDTQTTPQSGVASSTPWSVKLRSVADTNKSEVSNSSIPASWTKVRLRPVASTKNDSDKTSDGLTPTAGSNVPDDSSDFRRIVVSRKKPSYIATEKKTTPKKTDEPEVIEIIDLANAPSTEGNPIDLTDKSNEDKPIDLTLPIDLTSAMTPKTVDAQSRAETRATAVTADGSVLVSLAPEPNSEPVKILVGKKGLVKIRSNPGETKARVVWRLDLDEVRSAMLDMASFKVKLLLQSESENKDLAFASSDQCMRFANALHEMTNASDPEDAEESVSAEESVFVEQLNEEEQRVLEEFRQSKKQVEANAQFFPIDTAPEKPMSVVNAGASVPSSPLSEISGPGCSLSSADLRIAQSYQKMLKLQIPKEAVRHKMEQDCVDTKIVDFVLGPEAAAEDTGFSTGNVLTEEEQKVAASYERMLKMKIPPEGVRHKMENDGVSAKIQHAVLGKEASELAQADGPLLSAEEEKVANSYRKLLKMMIPKEAVEHKMRKDQVDEKILAAVLGIKTPSSSSAAGSKPGVPTLTDEEESVASSYRKMIGLRIPKEAIRQKMESEGISTKIIASVLGEKLKEEDSRGKPQLKRGKQGGFHWSPLVSSENLKNSVWSKSSIDSGFFDDADDISSHVEQFKKKVDSDDASRVTVKSAADSKDKAKLIDLGRANNVAITLKAFNEFSSNELAQIIEFVDPFEKIKGDRALFMKDLLPAAAEVKVIKSFDGPEDRLVPAEKWFRQIVHIKRIEEKIHVLRTMESFRNEAIALGETFQQLTNVCNQVMNSEKLPDILEMVRQIGNRMNNERGQEAAGFKLDFLPRLAQTKGSDKKTTALDLVVMIFRTRGRRDALLLKDDFPECYEASRIQIGELICDVKMLQGAMRKCQNELDALKKEEGMPPRSQPKLSSDCHSDSGLAKAKSSDSSVDEVRTQVSNLHEEMFAKRAEFLNAVLNKNASASEFDSSPDAIKTSNAEKSYTRQGAINRIAKFIEEGKIIFPELESKRDQALSACKELCEFFCESGGERNAPTLLGILSEFATNLSRAVTKYDQKQKSEARKKASGSTEEKPTCKTPKPSSSAHPASTSARPAEPTSRSSYHAEKKSLVLMVNEMLKVAGDKQREDFISGLTYDNPDFRLQQIYEAERKMGKMGSPAARKNILRTIEERRHLNGPHDSQAALSELALAMQKRSSSTDSESPTSHSLQSKGSQSFDDGVSVDQEAMKQPSQVPQQPSGKKIHKMTIAERWTRKVDREIDLTDEKLTVQEGEFPSIEKTDSQILASDSHDSDDRKYEEKKRQQYISRWAGQNALLKSNNAEYENESDVDGLQEHRDRTREKYMNRWASKQEDRDEDSITSDLG